MRTRNKKSLGQNFLTDKNIVNFIIKSANIKSDDTLIEIGPGTGNLTRSLISKKPSKLIIIEKDNELSKLLKKKFEKSVHVINQDFLKLNFDEINFPNLKIIGNLPYNISTQILIKLIRNVNDKIKYKKMILMFQKEVADRIVAKYDTKNYGRISIISQWKFKIKKLKNISSNSFYPAPKVDSSLLLFELKNETFKLDKIKNLEHVTNIFFNLRRKMIKKPLQILFNNPEFIAQKLNLNLSDRPQKINPEVFYKICKEYENQSINFIT